MQSSQPLVSVVIPCYNHEKFVQDSIQSVIDQTYKNIELIIIDDESKDSSVEKIREMIDLCEKRFTRFEFRSRPNKGLSSTLNEALEWCEGKYFSALASDDQMLKDKTSIQVDFLESNNEILGVFGNVILIDENNEEKGEILENDRLVNFEMVMLHEHSLQAATQMLRLKTLREVGGFKDDIVLEDWYMWLKISACGDIYSLNQIFSLYRLHENNTIKNHEIMHKGRLQVLDYFEDIGIDTTIYKKSIKRVKWINAFELLLANKDKKAVNFLIMMHNEPLLTLKTIMNKISKYFRKIYP